MQRLDTETRQEQIKKAVLEIISSEGLAKLTTRNLALKVGVTEGAIFRHFKSKNDIMLAIIDDVKNNLLTTQKVITFSKQSPDKKLFEFLCKHVKYLVENKGITILLFSEATHMNEPKLKEKLYEILSTQKKYVKKILEEGMNINIWDSSLKTENIAMMYMGIPISLNIELILNIKGFKLENFCKNMFVLFERILTKKINPVVSK